MATVKLIITGILIIFPVWNFTRIQLALGYGPKHMKWLNFWSCNQVPVSCFHIFHQQVPASQVNPPQTFAAQFP